MTSQMLDSLLRNLRTGLTKSTKHEQSRVDFQEFYQLILGWSLPQYQQELAELLRTTDRLLILAPPGHGKTTFIAAYAAWRLGLDPNERILVVSHTIDHARLILRLIENFLTSPAFRSLFGDLVPTQRGGYVWTATEKFLIRSDFTLKDPSLLALGVGSSTIGYRATILLADDLVTQTNSMTPTQRSHLRDWFWGSLIKRLEPGGQAVVIGARFYAQDLYGELLSLWPHRIFISTPEKPLWPERYDADFLRRERRQNLFAFRAQYEQKPADFTSAFLKESWLHYYLEAPSPLRIYQGVDPDVLASKTKGNAYFALATIGVGPDNRGYILDLIRAKANAKQQTAIIKEQALRWKPLLINIEANAAQALFVEHVIEETGLPIRRSQTQFDKATRFAAMATLFQNETVLLPGFLTSTGLEARPFMNAFLEEWRNFPNSTSDCLDAVEKALEVAFKVKVLPASVASRPTRTTELSFKRWQSVFR